MGGSVPTNRKRLESYITVTTGACYFLNRSLVYTGLDKQTMSV